MVEMAYFNIWMDASERERKGITRECGRITGEMIIHDIEQQYAEESTLGDSTEIT
jgi:hypothetical protein